MPATSAMRKKILTIDDEEAIVELISDILEANNYQTVCATRWTEALDAINHENPDLVLLDLKMPTIHGIAILEFIRSQGFDIPVIIVSGFVNEQTGDELAKYGVRGILRKPFKNRDLIEEVVRVLGPSKPQPEPDSMQSALNALYNRPPAPAPEPEENPGPVSMDALYGAGASSPAKSRQPTPPDKDILRALEKSAAPPIPPESPPPSERLGALQKQTIPPVSNEKPEPAPDISSNAHIDALLDSAPKREDPAPPANPYGLRESSRRRRPGRKRLGKGQLLVMSGITIVCIVIAGFLATMQWLSSQYSAQDIKQQAQDAISNQVKQELLKELQKQAQDP